MLEKLNQLWRETRGNIFVECCKYIGGATVLKSIGSALWRLFTHVPLYGRLLLFEFIAGLVLLVAAVWLQIARRKQHPGESLPDPPPTHTQGELLSPLQAKILSLSREVRAFLQEINPPPGLLNPGPIKAGEDIATEMIKRNAETDAWHVAHAQWARKRLYGYQNRYLGRVKEVANDIGEESGIVVVPLMKYVDDVKPLMDFDALPDLLAEFVAKLEKPEERRRLEEERRMQETRALLMDNSYERDNP